MVQRNDRSLDQEIMRDLTRTLLKVILVVLSVAGCTQSVTWIGEASQSHYKRKVAPAVYDRYKNQSTQQVVEEPQEDYYDEQF